MQQTYQDQPQEYCQMTVQLHGKLVYLAFSVFYRKVAHAQELSQATNTSFLAAEKIPWCLSPMPSPQAAVELSHWEVK